MDILIKNVTVLTMDDESLILRDTNVYIKGNRIFHIGDILEGFRAEEIIDGSKKVLMPGLINAHTHIGMSVFRNYGNDVSLETWLQDYIWPLEARLTAEDVFYASLVSIAEMIESGTTSFVDMYFFMDQVAKACEISGIRAVLTRGLTNPSDEVLEGERNFYKNFHGSSNGRIEMMLGSHAVYTNDKEHLLKEIRLAEDLGVGINIHLNETKSEVENSIRENGLPPLEYVDSLGMLNEKTIAAHCVWLSEKEEKIAVKRKINMVHNPSSNMKLASGFMEADKLMEMGVNVCLGTDGSASNNILDMFDEMRVGALIAKGYSLDPKNLSAIKVLKMATVNGAIALGKGHELGKVREGYLADLIIIDFDNIRHLPENDIAAALVYSTNGFDVETTIVDGKIVYKDHKHLNIDIEKLKEKINLIHKNLFFK